MSEQLSRATARLEKLKVAEEKKAKTIIKAIQQKVDEAAKKMATQNAEHRKQKQELEVGIWE
jgi:TPP-dependent pyruvate/acetoin dehydrogenase alpha subunit